MSFYATAYDTTAGRGMVTAKITTAIQQALIRNNFAETNNNQPGVDMPVPAEGCVPTLITTQSDEEMGIPIYAHPIYVDLSSVRKSATNTYMVSDARPFMSGKPVDASGNLIVKNKTEFDFTKNRTILSSLWFRKEFNSFKYLSPMLTSVYASWLSENISRRFALDAKDQHYIAILAAYLYQSFFYPYAKFEEEDRLKMAPNISRAVQAEIDVVIDTLDQFPVMEGLFDFCAHVKALTENPRLEELNPGLLIAMLTSSWFGTNGREIAAVGIEHVPTFVMMVYSSFTERTYRLAPISKITERFKGRKGEDDFIRSLKHLIQNQHRI